MRTKLHVFIGGLLLAIAFLVPTVGAQDVKRTLGYVAKLTTLGGTTASNPSITFSTASAGTGFYQPACCIAGVFWSAGSAAAWGYYSPNIDFSLGNGVALGWSSASNADNAPDLLLTRDAANILAQRNGTNPQTVRLYNTWTNASNGEWLQLVWNSGVGTLSTAANGTGTARNIVINAAGAQVHLNTNNSGSQGWLVSSGHLLAETDATYDIGASGATRPRTGYFSASTVAPIYSSGASSVLTITTNTITPVNAIHHLGAGLVKTITVPAACTPTCNLDIVPDAAFTTDATGNISLASTAVINRTLRFTWDGTKWNPSY